MSEQKPEKKVVSRIAAIRIGLIAVILLVSLVGAMVNYTYQISSLNSQVSNLQSRVNELNDTLKGDKYTRWVNNVTVSQAAGSYTSWTFSANSTNVVGSVDISFYAPTTMGAYVRVIYSYMSWNYDSQINNMGPLDEAIFPTLPSSSIEIRIGNTNFLAATETVIITYVY